VFGLINPLYKVIGIIGLVAVLFGTGYYRGYSAEKQRFDAFKTELEASAKAQEKINQQIEQKNKLIADNSKREYEAKIVALRHYYDRLRYPDTNKLPSAAITAHRVDEKATDPVFIGQCAETTLQLISLQDWVTAILK
jgi:ABC-type nitrate/sulfonate/bicarbonate transport system substrate-binding protein